MKRKTTKHNSQIPKQIRIGYRTIHIEQTTMDDFGEFKNNEGKIKISNNQTEIEKCNTLIHESLHGLVEDRINDLLTHKQEEIVVNTFSNGLVLLLKDNPKLLEYIYKTIKNKK